MPGHVFVTRTDIRYLRCHAWLLPTDTSLSVTAVWKKDVSPVALAKLEAVVNGPARYSDDWLRETRRTIVMQPWFEARGNAPAPIPILTNVGRDDDTPVDWYLKGLQQFLDIAHELCKGRVEWEESRSLLSLSLERGREVKPKARALWPLQF